MSDPMQAIFQNVIKTSPFAPTSRYFQIQIAKMENVEGKTIAYIRRRFVPLADRFHLLLEHSVVQGDRIDNVTAKYLGDPEQFWRVCDANNVMQASELTETVGSTIRITLPEGIPGQPNA